VRYLCKGVDDQTTKPTIGESHPVVDVSSAATEFGDSKRTKIKRTPRVKCVLNDHLEVDGYSE
jgi:hypothetical protein